MKKQLLALAGVGAITVGALAGAGPTNAADHLEAPLVAQDGRTDINDLYAFQSPEHPDNTVLVMTVNPGAGVLSPDTFDPDATYTFRVDRDGDARQDAQIRVRFGEPDADGEQSVRVDGLTGRAHGTTGEEITFRSGGRVMAGTFDDPFFFDFQAFQDQVKGAGGTRTFCDGGEVDFFAGLNVSAIVVEVPTERLDDDEPGVGIWGRTRTTGNQPPRTDRMGNPAIATVLINDGNEDQFNRRVPRTDVRNYTAEVSANLQFLSGLDGSGYTEEEANGIAGLLLPDILTLDASSPDGFVPGLNGRGLADDVIDFELFVVTGGLAASGTPVLDSDCVDANDVPFPGVFPYLAAPHS
ncbi:MAG: DUF4331 family protein [Actinomycetota bacterium]